MAVSHVEILLGARPKAFSRGFGDCRPVSKTPTVPLFGSALQESMVEDDEPQDRKSYIVEDSGRSVIVYGNNADRKMTEVKYKIGGPEEEKLYRVEEDDDNIDWKPKYILKSLPTSLSATFDFARSGLVDVFMVKIYNTVDICISIN